MENNSLAKISLGINALLVIAVIILFVKGPGGSGGEDDVPDSLSTEVNIVDDGKFTMAFYKSDSLSTKSDFVIQVQKDIENVQIKAQESMAGKEKEIQRWQKKWEDKGPNLLDREIQQYQQEAQEKQMEIGQFEQNLNMQVQMDQEKLMITLYQRLELYAASFCQEQNIDMLVSMQMGQNIIYMSPQYDVTQQFLNHVNNEYRETFEGTDLDEEGVE